MTLREMAEQAATTIEQAIGTTAQTDWIVQEIVRVAMWFGERVLREASEDDMRIDGFGEYIISDWVARTIKDAAENP